MSVARPARVVRGVRSCRGALVAMGRSASPIALVSASLVMAMLVGGILLRLYDVGSPTLYTFDEKLFVTNAHNYLMGLPDGNDHPPLGKLIMAVGMAIFGHDSLGWRFSSVWFGLHTLVIAYWLGCSLFERRAGWLAAAFIAADGFFISYSRAGLLDGILVCLILWAMLAAVSARGWLGVAGAAILIGLAASVKWSGALTLVPAAAAIVALGRAPRRAVFALALAPVVHALLWLLTLWATGQPSGLEALFATARSLFLHHLSLGDDSNPLASPWYGWLYLAHPIVTKYSAYGALYRYSSSVGNLAFWLLGHLALLATVVAGLALLVSNKARSLLQRQKATNPSSTPVAYALCVLGWLALLCPWMVARGKYTFSYHYLPSYAFVLVLLAGVVSVAWRYLPRSTLAFLGLGFAVGVYFAPVWAEIPISEGAANARLVFTPWRP